jgi:hypothetical protein
LLVLKGVDRAEGVERHDGAAMLEEEEEEQEDDVTGKGEAMRSRLRRGAQSIGGNEPERRADDEEEKKNE